MKKASLWRSVVLRAVAPVSVCAALMIPAVYAQKPSPVGLWKSFDNKTKKPNTLIRVYEENGKLFGRTEKLFKEPGQDQNPKCTKCDGEKKDQPILGLVIMWDLKRDGDKWTDGQIMDPDEGKTYGCKVELEEGGKKLKVRGFMGVSMFGRTEHWERAE